MIVSVLKGSFVFAADLVRAIPLRLRVEFLGVQSYGSGTSTTGVVQILQDLAHPIEDEDVLIVEDIVDTGLTLAYILSLLRAPSLKESGVPITCFGYSGENSDFQSAYGRAKVTRTSRSLSPRSIFSMRS